MFTQLGVPEFKTRECTFAFAIVHACVMQFGQQAQEHDLEHGLCCCCRGNILKLTASEVHPPPLLSPLPSPSFPHMYAELAMLSLIPGTVLLDCYCFSCVLMICHLSRLLFILDLILLLLLIYLSYLTRGCPGPAPARSPTTCTYMYRCMGIWSHTQMYTYMYISNGKYHIYVYTYVRSHSRHDVVVLQGRACYTLHVEVVVFSSMVCVITICAWVAS